MHNTPISTRNTLNRRELLLATAAGAAVLTLGGLPGTARAAAPVVLPPLPWAQPVIDNGRRLAASYANYLIVNGAVLMPAYGDPADDQAAAVLAHAYPDREIVQVPCRALIWQNGSLHCITMQLPDGIL